MDPILAMFDARRRPRKHLIDRNHLDDGQPLRAGDVFIDDGTGTIRRALPGEVPSDVAAAARACATEWETP